MKKKTIILLISILLTFIIGLNFNFNYAAAGDYYTDITQYTASDINDNNVTYVANLAKAYMQAHPELFSEPTTPSDPFFNYCYILLDYNTNNFAIYFSEDSSYIYTSSYSNGLRMRSDYSRTFALTSYNNFSVIFNFLIEGNTYVRYLYADICGESTNIDKEYVSTKVLSYDGDIRYRDPNFNFVNTITEKEENPTFYYNIQQSDLGYKVAIAPLNVDCPYSLKCYFDGNYDNYYTLQDNVANFQTSNFIINENVKKVLFVCEHPDGSFSLEINLETLYTDKKSYLNVNTIPAYISGHSLDKTYIEAYNMKEGYNIYWSYSTLFVKDNTLNYTLDNNNYEVETEVDYINLYFFITDENGKIIYTLKHNKQNGTFSSTNGEINSSNYTDLIVDEPPELPEDAEILDYIKYFFNMIGWGISQLLEFLKKIMTYVVDIGGIFSKCFNFFPSPIPQLFSIGIISVIIISLIKIARK